MASTAKLSRVPGNAVATGNDARSKRARLLLLDAQLVNARTSFESHWREIAELFRPRRIRLTPSDRNRGDKRNQKIIDSTTVYAARTLSSGMTTGITSAARVWYKWAVADKTLMEHAAVKAWLEDLREATSAVLLRSNFYTVLPTFYGDMGVFGTSAMIVEEDDEKVIRCTHFALGEYWIGYNSKNQVRVFMRKFQLLVRQVVEQFGTVSGDSIEAGNLSIAVQNAWARGQTEQPVDVVHIIYENPDHDASRLHAKYKQYASCYYESGAPVDTLLDEGGYEEWPVMAVRWETTQGDVYGTDCPGMTALGDAKELQFSKKLGAQAIEKAVKPPMVAPANMKNIPVSGLPGGITYFDETTEKKLRPAIDTNTFRLDYLREWVADVRDMIKRAFFEDLFLLIAQIDRGNVTATEILEKKEEKLLALGPVLEQVNEGFLDPFFTRLYGIMLRKGLVPPPPPEMNGVAFHPEYESIMAQAQRAQGRSGVEAFAVFVSNLMKDDPTIVDNVDFDEVIESYATMAGVPPKFIKSEEAVAAIRKARAEAQAKQQAAEQAQLAADSANKLAKSPTDGKNALTDLLSSNQAGAVLGGSPSPVGGL